MVDVLPFRILSMLFALHLACLCPEVNAQKLKQEDNHLSVQLGGSYLLATDATYGLGSYELMLFPRYSFNFEIDYWPRQNFGFYLKRMQVSREINYQDDFSVPDKRYYHTWRLIWSAGVFKEWRWWDRLALQAKAGPTYFNKFNQFTFASGTAFSYEEDDAIGVVGLASCFVEMDFNLDVGIEAFIHRDLKGIELLGGGTILIRARF